MKKVTKEVQILEPERGDIVAFSLSTHGEADAIVVVDKKVESNGTLNELYECSLFFNPSQNIMIVDPGTFCLFNLREAKSEEAESMMNELNKRGYDWNGELNKAEYRHGKKNWRAV